MWEASHGVRHDECAPRQRRKHAAGARCGARQSAPLVMVLNLSCPAVSQICSLTLQAVGPRHQQ
jgi:hypothetical protein